MPPIRKNKQALFLDRDGVINREAEGYITEWSQFEFLPGALEAIRRLTEEGYKIIIISNQSAINRGLATKDEIDRIMTNMVTEIEASGGKIWDIYYCPHRPEDKCDCRKPEPGLFFQAEEKHGVKITNTWFVGDKLTDVAVAIRIGARPILIRGGKVVPGVLVTEEDAVTVVDDLTGAVDYIIAMDRLRAVGNGS